MYVAILNDSNAVAGVISLPDNATPDNSGYGIIEPGQGAAINVTDISPRPAPGWSYDSGSGTFTPPAADSIPLAQQAAMALAAGLEVSSTSAPEINGIYAIDALMQGRIAAVSVYILRNNKFPGGGTTYTWPQRDGTRVTFSSTDVFQNFATAVADYVSALEKIEAENSGDMPPASVAIA